MLTRATVTLTVIGEKGDEDTITVTREHDGGGNPAFIQYELEQDLHAASQDAEHGLLEAIDRHGGMKSPTPRPLNPGTPMHLLNSLVDWLGHDRANYEARAERSTP